MAATAVLASVALVGTAASMETAEHSRRLASQKQDAQRLDTASANQQRDAQIAQEENRAFSKVQRQRQRALATNSSVPGDSGSLLGGGGAAVTSAAPGSSPTANKTILGQ